MAGQWKIHLVDGLTVFRPDGAAVAFRTRKAGALLAILTLRKGQALSRVALGDALWPGVNTSRQSTNVRQALSHIRLALGEDSPVIITRTSCRLDMDLVLCPDLDLIVRDPGACRQVLPEMIEPWFDLWRRNSAFADPAGLAIGRSVEQGFESAAAASLVRVLEWCIHYRPRAALEIVSSLPELAQAASPADMIKVLDAALSVVRATDPLFGWGLFQRAVALGLVGQYEKALTQLFAAKEHAVAHRERDLFVETCFYYAGTQIVTGDPELALEALREANELKLGRGSNSGTVRLRHGLGLALVHTGEYRKGLETMRRAYEICDVRASLFEKAYVGANWAWLEATCGNLKRASRVNDQVRAMEAGMSWRIVLTCLLAEAALALGAGDLVQAHEFCSRCLQMGEGYDSPGFIIYAHELSAFCAEGTGDDSERAWHWAKSKALRKQYRYEYTTWDRHRLKRLLEAESQGR